MIKVYSKRNYEIIKKDNVLVGYLLGGYPNTEDFLCLLRDLEDTELDVIEIGFPSNNPYSDGDIIKDAHRKVNFDLAIDINYWKDIRKSTSKPIWVMAYKKDFIDNKLYLEFGKANIMDALVVPDCTLEEHNKLEKELNEFGVDVLKFIRPTLSHDEIKKIVSDSALLYGQLYDGPTGTVNQNKDYIPMLNITLRDSEARIYAGFGINSKERVKELLDEGFHGTIIGTDFIKKLNISNVELIKYINEINKYIMN